MPLLELSGVSLAFGGLRVVDDLELHVDEGEILSVIGPNGAGKTTLSRMIGGVARRDGGELTVFGLDPWQHQTRVKSRIGWVLQQDALDDELNVAANLRLWGDFHGLSKSEIVTRSAAVLTLLGLEGREKSATQALSGGMRRRLAIARALLTEPEFLILDEPTTGLDPQVRHQLWGVLRRLKEGGLTVLVTTHYMEEAARIADRVIVLHKGKVVAEGGPDDLIRRHLRRYVLELAADDAPAPERLGCAPADVRRHGDRVLAFHDDEAVLRSAVAASSVRAAHVRPSSLEDVFMELTGSTLDG